MLLNSQEEFEACIKANNAKLIVYIFDPELPSHEHLNAVIEELSTDFSNIVFKKVEYRHVKNIVQVASNPAILAYKADALINTLEGCSTQMLVTFVRGWAVESNQSTIEKIEKLLNDNPVIIFIKGDKHEPFCRFSRAVVNMFNECGIEFEAFNIFDDPLLREELKKYSKWPTYPQLYINKVLIGGHDIIKELYEAGTLRDEFPKEFLREIK
ncbi:bifunctional Thioredoxin-like superfamily/Glutaredoxin/Monothiol glutaredoxin-related/Glutaredoxin [Babesia duncani]|uniref:Bifunctional Thioredoxin-like superfamily/Glutaredoxin/Monothiol glutaredoxin-related/Glutaredoxin n=1 Tax=Babesia duncani TaxID=323732 RepID=A0AAD9PIC8_9APIC|nr:bifunctional Thioredoxin-like superfamily/Glutaredoxin/Monothiol glutaredoxin-related/Glutaredoxin [Babesia duncani]